MDIEEEKRGRCGQPGEPQERFIYITGRISEGNSWGFTLEVSTSYRKNFRALKKEIGGVINVGKSRGCNSRKKRPEYLCHKERYARVGMKERFEGRGRQQLCAV